MNFQDNSFIIIKEKIQKRKIEIDIKEQKRLEKFRPVMEKIVKLTAKPEGRLARLIAKIMEQQHEPVVDWALKHINIHQDWKILDIGFGSGYNLFKFAKRAIKGTIYGIEISEAMIKTASERVNNENYDDRIVIIQASADSLPFRDDYFDLIVAVASVHYWNNPKKCFNEIYRALKPNGMFLTINNNFKHPDFKEYHDSLIEHSPSLKIYSPQEYYQFYKSAEFSDIKIYIVESENWICLLGQKKSNLY
ncbi:MAG: class I SAM-dependent methyltransferase [Promethearchaeota archaeon]